MAVLDDLTLKETEAYNDLKRRIGEDVNAELRNDAFLCIRFLRAREFNVDLAENMLKNHIAWRRINQIDNILTTYVPEEVAVKYLPLSRIGLDKEGSPVNYFDFGNADLKGVLKSCKTSAAIKTIVRFLEESIVEMEKKSEKLGKPINRWIFILDFDNYSFAKATHKQTIEGLIELFMCYEANYPERLKAAYIINASLYFSLVFAIIKPLLSGNTIKKVHVFGKSGWKEELCRSMDLQDLPAFLGGKRTDPDGNPMCKTDVKHGCMVPEDLFMTRNAKRLNEEPGVQKLTVSRKSKETVALDVKHAGSTIEWEFETECRDIGFGLLYKTSDDDKSETAELIPRQRIDTHLSTEVGMFVCEKPGKYILMFDNSYSWIHQKEIYIKAEVVGPTDKSITE